MVKDMTTVSALLEKFDLTPVEGERLFAELTLSIENILSECSFFVVAPQLVIYSLREKMIKDALEGKDKEKSFLHKLINHIKRKAENDNEVNKDSFDEKLECDFAFLGKEKEICCLKSSGDLKTALCRGIKYCEHKRSED